MNSAIRILWQRHGLTALLILIALMCLAVLGFETGWGQALRPAPPVADNASRAKDVMATLPGFFLDSLENAFKETGERPLFTPTRRPAAVNPAGAPVMKKGQFKLSGTTVNNELAVAFLLETATGKTVRVTKGKEINGITLDAVEPNRVVLKQGDETEELVLRTSTSPPRPTPTPAPVNAAVAPAPVPGAPQPQPVAMPPPVRTVVPPQAGAPNPLVPAPGSSQLPGFVLSPTPATPQAQGANPVDPGSPAQRRRRTQPPQQQ